MAVEDSAAVNHGKSLFSLFFICFLSESSEKDLSKCIQNIAII